MVQLDARDRKVIGMAVRAITLEAGSNKPAQSYNEFIKRLEAVLGDDFNHLCVLPIGAILEAVTITDLIILGRALTKD